MHPFALHLRCVFVEMLKESIIAIEGYAGKEKEVREGKIFGEYGRERKRK